MPDPNAILSNTIRLSGRGEGEEVTVELDGDRRIRLDPADPKSSGYAEVLRSLAERGHPVYVEIDPDAGSITRLLIPVVSPVVGLTERDGGLDVELERSNILHALRLDGPDAAGVAERLRAALREKRPVVVVEDDLTHDIIELASFTPNPDGGGPPFDHERPKLPLPTPLVLDKRLIVRILLRIWWWCCRPWWWWFRCISATRAQQVFDAMATTNCNPSTVPPPCIPFMYPDNGCWARAHEMCRLMKAQGLKPRKVWITGGNGNSLKAATKNRSNCEVVWNWHVAPILCVRTGFFSGESMVIDPSLCTTPVTQAAWKATMTDPASTLVETDADQYYKNGGTDPGYTQTNADLQNHRDLLNLRWIQTGGPPYPNC